MNRTLMDFWVGLFVLLGMAALVFVALRVANQTTVNQSETYPVIASFSNIGGLKVRSPVKSAGVTVGRVTHIELDPSSYQAKVSLALSKKYSFSSDTAASILTSGLLGEQYVGLEPGGETEMLKAGDSITLTSSALVLENLIGKFVMSKVSTSDTSGEQ
ncbi:MAG: outer membrane lipid asymmetry maintenance protein MlaD [Oleiphilus sp.]|nr:MAG: outer membrane lipid asymmetry maintenance protein MlaD [Oleiphilus sp.]